MANIPLDKPNIERQFLNSTKDELFALKTFLRYYWYMPILLLAGLAVFIYEIRPLPPRTVTIATGQPLSTYDDIGKWYKDFFNKHGVDLRLVPTNGAAENLNLLAAGKVDAAFTQGGVPIPAGRNILSLGSIQLEPLWLFYRGDSFTGGDALEFIRSKHLSVGPPGSGTQHIVADLAKQYKLVPHAQQNFVQLPTQEAIDALLSGKIDGMFLLASPDSAGPQTLLRHPEIKVWDFKTSKAIASKIHHAYAVEYPMGAVSLSPVLPPQDVHLVATNTGILAPESMHPAIQYLFIMASSSYYRNNHFMFDLPNGFPAFLDHDVAKSDIAVKYLSKVAASFEYTFPFWLASFIDRAWLLLATLFAIIYPLMQMAPQYRKFHFKADMRDRYGELRRIEMQLHQVKSQADLEDVKLDFQILEDKLAVMWTPSGAKGEFYNIVQGADVIRGRIERAQAVYRSNNESPPLRKMSLATEAPPTPGTLTDKFAPVQADS